MKKRVLITGGLGYVGSVLVPHLARRWPVRVYDSMLFGNAIEGTPNVEFAKGDILDEKRFASAMRECTDVIHLAGIVTDELVDMSPGYARQVNVAATERLCALAGAAGVQRLVYASSSSVYGTQETVCTEESPTQPMTAYAQNKLDAEEICLKWSNHMTVTAVRSATCMGPAPRMRLDTIVNAFSKQAYFDRVITVHDGTQWRSNIHVQDIAELYTMLLEAEPDLIGNEVFNAVESVQSVRTALDIALIVQTTAKTVLNRQVEIQVDHSKKDERHYRMNGTKLKTVLGWEPNRRIPEAVGDNFGWFMMGWIGDPDDDLWYNTRRMAPIVKGVS